MPPTVEKLTPVEAALVRAIVAVLVKARASVDATAQNEGDDDEEDA